MQKLTDEFIASRLAPIGAVYTPVHGVRNEIVAIDSMARCVTVRSARTGRERVIPFDDIRNADEVTANGVIARTLRTVVTNESESEE